MKNSFFNLILAIFLICQSFLITAQVLEPQIKFDLYFEDAIGNRDTVTYGFDPFADANINPIFGEFNIRGVPFDSIFEVRSADVSGYQFQSNPTVNYYNPLFCTPFPNVQYASMIIYAKHWPIKISWDSTYFEENCYDWTHFTRIFAYILHPEFIDGDIRLLEQQSQLTVYKQYMQQSVSYYNSRLEPIEGGGQDTVYNLWVGLCGHDPSTVVSTQDSDADELAFRIAPNPVGDVLNLILEDQSSTAVIEKLTVLDMLGGEVVLSNGSEGLGRVRYDVFALAAGTYYGKVLIKGRLEPVMFRFVKL